MVGNKERGVTAISAGLFVTVICSILFASCTNLTEYEMAFKAGLHVIAPEDFSVISTISDMPGARSLMMYPGNIFIASTEGLIYRYDSETLELVEAYQVALPSPAGFSQMVYCSLKNTAYLIGSLGNILEVSLPECTVIDEFAVCQSPTKLALGPGSEYLFVADGPSKRIHQVSIDNNHAYDNVGIYFNIYCMEPSPNPDSMLVGTSAGIDLIEVISPTDIRGTRLYQGGAFFALASVPDDTIYVGVKKPLYGAGEVAVSVGIVDVFIPEFADPPPPEFYETIEIEGTGHLLAMGKDWQHAYVLSYLGDNTSRLISYNYRFSETPQELDLPGFPLDLKVSGNGVIYVLTTE
ncbi:MAG: hypothetical protein KAS73_09350 [Candidatus Sabulitectum sp.]|nr:hypothetical protein [Candidatus Sabulitectum sp.]